MKLELTGKEKKLLKKAKISFKEKKDYTDDEILEMADMLFDQELEYSESNKKSDAELAGEFAELYDKLQGMFEE